MTTAALTILALSWGATALNAQIIAPTPPVGSPLLAEAKQSYASIKNYLTAMAAKMPAVNYAFKPTPAVRTFGGLVAHVADTQMRTCSMILGDQKTADAATQTAKAGLVAALRASFDECDAVWDTMTEANALQLAGGRVQRTRLGTMISSIVVHDNEEYGYMAVYLRLKGIVPPSSDRSVVGGGGR